MLDYARDQGFLIDHELRSEITRLLTGRSASEPQFVSGPLPAAAGWDESGPPEAGEAPNRA